MMCDPLIRRWHLVPEGEGHFSEISITFGIKDVAFRQEEPMGATEAAAVCDVYTSAL
ncbi:hypothetical protein Lmor_1972 [Legionella moravica]|uniref:Uncharacterized protein n=1 Tax=Legionella moravica TaxID=39962 RepID=A0A378JVA9_9GAMM|nr:hypothetical protein Lmor_1972 [Legionella moravica]STX62593.1 Uncharacterised protein [Legionella moravica]